MKRFPAGTAIERDCYGNLRAVPPGSGGHLPADLAPATSPKAPQQYPGAHSPATVPTSTPKLTVDQALARLRATPGVVAAQSVGGGWIAVKTHLSSAAVARLTGGTVTPERLFTLLGSTTAQPVATDDPYFAKAWYLADWGQGGVGDLNNDGGGWWSTPGASADAAQAWPYSVGTGVTIAEIDGGVQASSSELTGRISPLSESFLTTPPSSDVAPVGTATDYDHGNLVANVLVGNAGNGSAAAGIAPGAQVMDLKCSDDGQLSDACIYQAGEYAINNGAKIINMSFGTTYDDPIMASLISDANTKGVLVVAAAGNNQSDNDTTPFHPATFDTTYFNGQPFKIGNGLTLASLPSTDGISSVPVGTWGTLACQSSSCPATRVA
ncbi:MAG TPA: S8 family serine peptidase [Acidimicrobiales bacterium]|nr:S8 family serine peptidase [Acidimicrobiales bacterium]